MAYITRANFKRISCQLNEKQYDGELVIVCEDIPQLQFEYFNRAEKKAILAFKEFVLHPDIILQPEYRKLNKKDTKTYVFESVAAYHSNIDCDKLHQDFNGILLPEKIKNQGDAKIEEFRQWYRDNMHLLAEDKEDIFELHMSSKFGVKINEIGYLDKKNSGPTMIDNYSLEEICNQITSLAESFRTWLFTANDKETSDLRRYAFLNIAYRGKCTYWGDSYFKSKENIKTIQERNKSRFSAEDILKCLYEAHHDFKVPMIDLLKKYYMIKYNSKSDVAINVLESLGFKPCSKCYAVSVNNPSRIHHHLVETHI